MTQQEIEEAIKNGESVWVANKYCYPYKVKLTNKHYVGVINDIKCLMLAFQNEDDELIDYLEYIFETKEKAQHYHDHANVERVETLPFLTWEEFLKEYSFDFYSSNHEWFTMYWNDVDGIVIENIISIDDKKTWGLTEENFYKAYDECVKLFKQE